MEHRRVGELRAAAGFMILMAGLGVSDSLRGIFAPVFQQHFTLNASGLSVIIMVSYPGNLVFLSLGGQMMDRFDRKKTTMAVLLLWMAALVVYVVSDHFLLLLVSVFFAMGASTLLNTTVNLLTPLIFTAAPGMLVNVFFFVQGVGTSASQNLVGRMADSYGVFRGVNLFLLGLGILAALFLAGVKIPGSGERPEAASSAQSPKKAVSFAAVTRQPGFWLLVVIFGFYFVAEHGIMNWLVAYGTGALGLEASRAALYLSGFYGGMTVGRLVFSPAVSALGAVKSICGFGGIGAVLFILGSVLGGSGLWLLSLSGLFLSIVYPTMVFMIGSVFPQHMLSTAAGAVISLGTLADIGFNLVFGRATDYFGYGISFMAVPLCMAGFYLAYLVFAGRFGARSGQIIWKRG